MNIKEIKEIQKRARLDADYRIAICHVNDGTKVYSTVVDTLSMEEDVLHKYLAIIKKAFSGSAGNNLHNLEFSVQDELEGEKHKDLLALFPAMGKNEQINNALFDKIIATYDRPGRYAIMCVYDRYDVPKKSADGADLDESDEVFDYMVCMVCPVELSKPGLEAHEVVDGLFDDSEEIEERVEIINTDRRWIIKNPESAFMFPAFTDRSKDIHSALFYTKNPAEPHQEFAQEILGKQIPMAKSTAVNNIFNLVTNTLTMDKEQAVLYIKYKASQLDEEVVDVPVDRDVLETLAECLCSDEEADRCEMAYGEKAITSDDFVEQAMEIIAECPLNVGDLYNMRELESAALLIENIELKQQVKRLMNEN